MSVHMTTTNDLHATKMLLRDFLLASQRINQPIDDAIVKFTDAVRQSQEDGSLITLFVNVHPTIDPLLELWPDVHHLQKSSQWEKRESIAAYLEALSIIVGFVSRTKVEDAITIAIKIIQEKLPSIEKLMTWSDKPLVEYWALDLLASLVQVSGLVAREFVRVFNFQSAAFQKMAARRMKKDESGEDLGGFQVRQAYVKLVVALASVTDSNVQRFVLKEGGLLGTIFRAIDGDSPEILSLQFSTLTKLVLNNSDIDNSSKSALFNMQNLSRFMMLMQSEIEDVSLQSSKFIKALFLSEKAFFGIDRRKQLSWFLQKSNDISSDAHVFKMIKHVLLSIGLSEYFQYPQLQDLLCCFLRRYPGLLIEYLGKMNIALEPRMSYRWFSVASFVQKVLTEPLDSCVETFSENEVPPSILLSLVMPLSTRKELSRGIQHSSSLVVYTCLGIIKAVFLRFSCFSSRVSVAYRDTLATELRFLLPSPEALVSLLTKLSADFEQQRFVYTRALEVFRLYLESFPSFVKEIKVDFAKLVVWRLLDQNSKLCGQSLTISEMLHCLIAIDESRLLSLLIGDHKDSEANQLLLLCNFFINSKDSGLQELSGRILEKVLISSRIFMYDEKHSGRCEVQLWCRSLRDGNEQTARFMVNLLKRVVKDPFSYVRSLFLNCDHNDVSSSTSRRLELSPVSSALILSIDDISSGEWRDSRPVANFFVQILSHTVFMSKSPDVFVKFLVNLKKTEISSTHQVPFKRRKLDTPTFTATISSLENFFFFCDFVLGGAVRRSNTNPAIRQYSLRDGPCFKATLMSISPSTFIQSFDDILQDAKRLTGCYEDIFSYIRGEFGIDLFSIPSVQAAIDGSSGRTSNLTEEFLHRIPFDVLLLSFLTRYSVTEHRGNPAKFKTRTTLEFLNETLMNRIRNGSLTLKEAHVANRMIMFFGRFVLLDVSQLYNCTFALLSSYLLPSTDMHFDDFFTSENDSTILLQGPRPAFRGSLCFWRQFFTQCSFQCAQDSNLNNILATLLHGNCAQSNSYLILIQELSQVRNDMKSFARLAIEMILFSIGTATTASNVGIPVAENFVPNLWQFIDGIDVKQSVIFAGGVLRLTRNLGGCKLNYWRIVEVLVPLIVKSAEDSPAMALALLKECVLISRLSSSITVLQTQNSIATCLLAKPINLQLVANLAVACEKAFHHVVSDNLAEIFSKYLVQSIVDTNLDSGSNVSLALMLLQSWPSFSTFQKNSFSPIEKCFSRYSKICNSKVTREQILIFLLILRRPQFPRSAIRGISTSLWETSIDIFHELIKQEIELCDLDTAFSILRSCLLLLEEMQDKTESEASRDLLTKVSSVIIDAHVESIYGYEALIEMSMTFLRLVKKNHAWMKTDSFLKHLDIVVQNKYFVASLRNPAINVKLLRTLIFLMQKCGAYSKSLLLDLLGCYNVSLSMCDRLLRYIFFLYESEGGILLKDLGFRFGAVVDEIKQKDLTRGMQWLANGGIDPERIRATIEYFPSWRGMDVTSDESLSNLAGVAGDEDRIQDVSDALVYDPSFFFPMTANALSSSSINDQEIIRQGGLGVCIRGTSSFEKDVREYCYGLLAVLHESLSRETSEFKASRQVFLMLENFRNAIEFPLQRIPSLLAVFMNDAINILSRPAHTMFPHLNYFLLARPYLDLRDVPMFYGLFNSSSPTTYKQERSWMLHFLRRGICDSTDVDLLIHRHVLSVLLSFYGSQLSDEHTRNLILQVLVVVSRVPKGRLYLQTRSNVYAWLGALLRSHSGDKTFLSYSDLDLIVEIVDNITQPITFEELDEQLRATFSVQLLNVLDNLLVSVQELTALHSSVLVLSVKAFEMLVQHNIAVPMNIVKHSWTLIMSCDLDRHVVRLCDLITLIIETLLSGSTEICVESCVDILSSTTRKLCLGKSHIDIGVNGASNNTIVRIHNLFEKHTILMECVRDFKLLS